MSATFELDARLAADTVLVGHSEGGRVLLMDDARWPWLLLVPEHAGISQLHELEAEDSTRVLRTSLAIARAMTGALPGHRINVGALGNVVAQLHVHHVLRREGDPAWPGPVWGHGRAERYAADERDAALRRWRTALAHLL
ncbi:MAG: HIT family protein [Pseudomonadales bacterium]|jgi:diadenosine tetraphosphate (Ap4A) HIT family hydrolase|nr:HIT family protein [Pseudomonadales bacterium]